MAKTLRTAAIIIGAAALIASGVGAAAGAGLIGASAGSAAAAAGAATSASIAATAATVASAAGAAASALSIAATVTMPKGTIGGNPTKFKIDKDAGIPVVFGRTFVGGNVIHRQYYSDPQARLKNQRESWVTVLSLGPVKSVGPLLVDKKPVYFDVQGNALGDFAGSMWLDTQLGACPEARALRAPTGDFPGWNASSKLSGKAADLWTLDFDTKGKLFPNGVPQRGRVLEGRFAYDPRLDSTYPGGSGACRIDDPATHIYTENPWLHAITFAYGLYQNGHLVAGGELPITGIDLNPFVQAANTADLNRWKCGGLVYTTADNDWDILKMLAQAGGGEVFPVGGLLSCTHAAPRVSIGTITSADIIGDIVAPSTASMRVRRNTIIPRVRLEEQGWEVVPITAVTVPAYAVVDRATRPKETEYPLIQSTKQAAEVAMYEMLDARELQPISLPCKLPAIGYRPGDCITLDIPEANLVGRDVLIRERELDMGTFGVTFTARSEDPAKHPFALGTSTTPPPTPDLSVPGLDLDPPVGWTAVATMVPSPSVPMPAIVVSGQVDNGGAEAVLFEYRPQGTTEWLSAGTAGVEVTRVEITTVVATARYDVAVRYRVRGVLGDRLVLGPVQIPDQAVTIDWANVADRTGTRPANNADVTGDNTSRDTLAIGGRPATDVINTIDLNGLNILGSLARLANLQAALDAVSTLEGKPIGAFVTDLRTQLATEISSVAADLSLVFAKNAAGTGGVINGDVVSVSGTDLTARSLRSIIAEVGEHDASLTSVMEALFDKTGATLRSVFAMSLDGVVTGLFNTLTGKVGSLVIAADVLEMVQNAGGQPRKIFSYGLDGTIRMGNVEVDRLKVGTGGTTNLPSIVAASAGVAGAGMSNIQTLLQTTIVTDGPATIFANAAMKNDYASGARQWENRLWINGQRVFRSHGTATIDSIALMGGLYLPAAGTYTVAVDFAAADSTVVVEDRTLFAVAYYGIS